MIFITGFIIGAVCVYGVVKWSVHSGCQGEYKFCTGCPLKEGFPMTDDLNDMDEPEEVTRNVSDRPDTSPRKFSEFFDD